MFRCTLYCCDLFFFFFNDPATTEIYTYRPTLSLHDALPISAAGGAARHAEAGPGRGLAQAHHRLLADPVEAVAEADGGRRLALAGRRRRDRRHQDELAVLVLLDRLEIVVAELGLRRPELHQRVCRNAELFADLGDRLHLRFASDFDI